MKYLLVAATVMVTICGSVARASDKVRIVIEAEHYTEIRAPMVVTGLVEDASGGKCVTVPRLPGVSLTDPDAGAYVAYRIRVPHDGRYRIWVRMQIRKPHCNFTWMVVDVDEPSRKPSEIKGIPSGRWVWRKRPEVISLTAGEHTARLHRFATGVECDQLILTNDLRWKPVKPLPETPEFLIRDSE